MPNCKLCKKNEAKKRNSHIFSAFFVRDVIGKRGDENSYVVSNDPNIDYTQNHTDKTVKTDYILCECCENRIGYAETYFAAEFTQKVNKPNFAPNFVVEKSSNGIEYINCTKINNVAFTLFVYSLFWRASVTKDTETYLENKHLHKDDEEEIRQALDNFLPSCNAEGNLEIQQKQWLKFLNEHCEELPNLAFTYTICKSEPEQGKYDKLLNLFTKYGIKLEESIESHPINSLLSIDFSANGNPPYSIFVGENIIQLKPQKFPITNNGREVIKILLTNFDTIINYETEILKIIAISRKKNDL